MNRIVRRRFADGRLIAIRYQALENGHQVCTYEDITERERAAEALKEQHRRFDVALNNMAHGLCMFDKDWRVVVRNRRYLELYGLGPNDAQPGTPLLEMMRHSIDRGMHSGKVSPASGHVSVAVTLRGNGAASSLMAACQCASHRLRTSR